MGKQGVIIDYGMGNLFSVAQAFAHWGATPRVIAAAADLAQADYLVLPGVGAFGDAMAELQKRGLVAAIQDFAARGKPFLGICLGMQLMLEASEEFGLHQGLGLIPGQVQAIARETTTGENLVIPHIGWNQLLQPASKGGLAWEETILAPVPPGTDAYFVHSLAAVLPQPAHCLAEVEYGGWRLTAAIGKGNLYGCQFHPEKSGPWGLQIIKSFLEL